MVSVVGLKSSQTEHDVDLVNYRPIWSEIENEAGCDLDHSYIVIIPRLSVRSNQDISPREGENPRPIKVHTELKVHEPIGDFTVSLD